MDNKLVTSPTSIVISKTVELDHQEEKKGFKVFPRFKATILVRLPCPFHLPSYDIFILAYTVSRVFFLVNSCLVATETRETEREKVKNNESLCLLCEFVLLFSRT